MELKNFELEYFVEYLFGLPAIGYASRMKTRFKDLLLQHHDLYLKEQRDIYEEYAIRNDDGFIYKEKGGEKHLQFNEEDTPVINAALLDLGNQRVIISANEERKDMLLSVRDSVEKDPREHIENQADWYNRIYDFLEQIEQKEK